MNSEIDRAESSAPTVAVAHLLRRPNGPSLHQPHKKDIKMNNRFSGIATSAAMLIASLAVHAADVHTNAVQLIKKIESQFLTFPGAPYARKIEGENQRVRGDVANWQKEIEEGKATDGVFVGRGSFGMTMLHSAKKALGEADRETEQLLTPLRRLKDSAFVVEDEATGEPKLILPTDPANEKYLVGKVLWYGPYGLGFLAKGMNPNILTVLLYSNGTARAHGQLTGVTPSKETPAVRQSDRASTRRSKAWPRFDNELRGTTEIRVKNPNDFTVKVGVRSGNKGRDFSVLPQNSKSVYVPDGHYDIFFQYSSDPDGLYQGDSFTLNGDGVEIQIVKVARGNYGIRKVK